MEFGRVHCFLVATKSGQVVYERYYDRYTELDKAEIRAAFQQATEQVNLANDNHDFVGAFRYDVSSALPNFRLHSHTAPD